MNKLLILILLSFSCIASKTQCDAPEQNEYTTQIAWMPNPELLPLLDKCYEDTKHPIIDNGIMRSKGDLLFNLFGEVARTPQEKEFAKTYCKYLGMHLYFAQQLLFEDEEVADYVKGINLQDYQDILNEQTAQMIKFIMPGELFMLMNIFLRDAVFQESVEQFIEEVLQQFYQ